MSVNADCVPCAPKAVTVNRINSPSVVIGTAPSIAILTKPGSFRFEIRLQPAANEPILTLEMLTCVGSYVKVRSAPNNPASVMSRLIGTSIDPPGNT